MSSLSISDRTFLESLLEMQGGYVLDFSNTSFAQLFADARIDIYDDAYAEFGTSKANRLRAFWQLGSNDDVALSIGLLADYIEAKQRVDDSFTNIQGSEIASLREIGEQLRDKAEVLSPGVIMTTEASVSANRLSIEIHADIYAHISSYLASGDHYHAVEESYKLVREKLRDLTGKEKASDVFTNSAQSDAHYEVLFGKAKPSSLAEADFFRGVGYLHLGVQHLRNEKSHTPATPLEPNLALHYISLASLAYDLITRYVSTESIIQIEEMLRDKKRAYRTATAFYRDFEGGKWLNSMVFPDSFKSATLRRALKDKWLAEADFSRRFDHSNLMFMRLEAIATELTMQDIDFILGLPTVDHYGNDQMAGLDDFLEFMQAKHPSVLSAKALSELERLRQR